MGDQLPHPDADRHSQRYLTYPARLNIGAKPERGKRGDGGKEGVRVAEQPSGEGIGDGGAQADPGDRAE